ncbi:MAG TPA: hypothetical protein VIJ38_18230 [Acidobacteriaceae bacterium]
MDLTNEVYRALDNILAASPGETPGLCEFVQTAPVAIPDWVFSMRRERIVEFQRFFGTAANIFSEAVNGKRTPLLLRLLLNDVPMCYAADFHRALPREAWTCPRFYRTDESVNGKVFEIQCPGSGWGDLQLLRNFYSNHGHSPALTEYAPSLAVADEIVNLCSDSSPSVLHLLDNASNPTSMRYLMATTQPPLRYWGQHRSVRNGDCQFVRSHSFFGLVAENLFKERLRLAAAGRARFDLPPVLVFDEKIALCLPFLDETQSYFTDAIRNILTYSHPVFENGFKDENGQWVSIQDFLKRRPSERRYFLKYAGCDVALNWGSRGVYRLDDRQATIHLTRAVEDSKQDRFWLIQPEISEKEHIEYFTRSDKGAVQEQLTAKYSCFYGPTQLIGIRTMHRRHYKVHGQDDTVIGLAVPGYWEERQSPNEDGIEVERR